MVRLTREFDDSNDSPATAASTHGVEVTPVDAATPTPATTPAIAEQQPLTAQPSSELERQTAHTPEVQTTPEIDPKTAEKLAEINKLVEIRHRIRTNDHIGSHNRDPREEGGVGPIPPDGESKKLGDGYAQSLRALEFNPGLQQEIRRLAETEAARIKEWQPNQAVDPNVLAQEIKADAGRILGPLTYPSIAHMGPVILWDDNRNGPPKTRHFQRPMTKDEALFAMGSPLLVAGQEGRHLGLYAQPAQLTMAQVNSLSPQEASDFFRRRGLDAQARTALLSSISPAEQVAFLAAEMTKSGMLSPLRHDAGQALKLIQHAPIGPYLDQVDRFVEHEIPWRDPDAWEGVKTQSFESAAVNLSHRSLQELGDGLIREGDAIENNLDAWLRDGQITPAQASALEHQAHLVRREGADLAEHFGRKGEGRGLSDHDFAREINEYVTHKINPLLRQAHRGTVPGIPILGQTNNEIVRQSLAIAHGAVRPSLPNAPHGFRQQGPGTDALQLVHHYADKAMTMAQGVIERPQLFEDFQRQQKLRGSTRSLDQQQWQQLQLSQQEKTFNEQEQQRAIQLAQQERARQAELQQRALTLEITQAPERGYRD